MVLESPQALATFLKERYRLARSKNGNGFRPSDIYDHKFPEFVDKHAPRILSIARRLKERYPSVPEEKHALMAYLLHVLDIGEPHNDLPHRRIVRAPARFFYGYLRDAGYDLESLLAVPEYRYGGVPVSVLLDGVHHDLGERVLKKRFTPPRH